MLLKQSSRFYHATNDKPNSQSMSAHDSKEVVDVQNAPDCRRLAIDKVGIKSLRHPVRISNSAGIEQHTVATFNMYVGLAHHLKGTHMSRFVELLNAGEPAYSVSSFEPFMMRMLERLDAESGYLEMAFTYFIKKSAPVSSIESLLDYDVSFIGEYQPSQGFKFTLRVTVPVTSLCPCSKEISAYGAHNQRSHVTVTVELRSAMDIEDLVGLVESEASCQLYGLLKRSDEKFVTEYAYDHPKFVEDMVRDVATNLNLNERVMSYRVESENFESIHNHSAYAMIERKHTKC